MFGFFKKSDSSSAPEVNPVDPLRSADQKTGWATRLKQGLRRTREQLGRQLSGLFTLGGKIDEELFEQLETVLLTADVGIDATTALLDRLRQRVK